MRKNVLLISMILSMFVFGLQIAEPVAATSWKTIDHGTTKFKSYYGDKCTYKWTTYQSGKNYVKMVGYMYSPQTNTGVYIYDYFKKVSKTKLKNYGKDVGHYYNYKTSRTINFGNTYCNTKLTAAQYYWKVFRPYMIKNVGKL